MSIFLESNAVLSTEDEMMTEEDNLLGESHTIIIIDNKARN